MIEFAVGLSWSRAATHAIAVRGREPGTARRTLGVEQSMRSLQMLAGGVARGCRVLGQAFVRAFALGVPTILAIATLAGSVAAAENLWRNPTLVAWDLAPFGACAFLVPIAVAGWWSFFPAMFRGRRGERVASLRVRRSGAVVRVRMPAAPPIVLAVCCFSPLSFAWVWLCAAVTDAQGSAWIAGAVWSLMLAACAVIGAARWRSLRAGNWDLVIDHDARTITLPRSWRRKTPATIAFESIREIAVEQVMG